MRGVSGGQFVDGTRPLPERPELDSDASERGGNRRLPSRRYLPGAGHRTFIPG